LSADPQSAAEAWNPGQVELTVQMDVGSAPLTLDALQSLQAGYVFELETPAATPVTARINGTVIGSGELVRIGDKLGVRLVRVSPHAH
jgi:type III secretion protein Q